MSHTTLAVPSFGSIPICSSALVRSARLLTEAIAAAVQSALFASLLWLLLAGPGFLQNLASTIPLP